MWGKVMAIGPTQETITQLLDAAEDANGNRPQIGQAQPALTAPQLLKWNTLQVTFRDAMDGDAYRVVKANTGNNYTLLDGWRALRGDWGIEEDIDQGALYNALIGDNYEPAKEPDVGKFLNQKYSDCLRCPDHIPDPARTMLYICRFKMGPAFTEVMSKLRFQPDVTWRAAKKQILDFVKSGQVGKQEKQGTILTAQANVNTAEIVAQVIAGVFAAGVFPQNSLNSGGKGAGKYGKYGQVKKNPDSEKTCWHCGRRGHTMQKCWDKIKGKNAKGKGKGGKGKGKGKGKW